MHFSTKTKIHNAFGFKAWNPDPKTGIIRQVPLWSENALGMALRKRLDRMHQGEEYDHSVGPPWHFFCRKRALGSWTMQMVWEKNLLVTSGILASAQILGEVGAEVGWKWLEIGTGVVAADVGDTLLGSPVITDGMARADVTPTVTVETSNTLRLDGTFGPNGGAAKAITEAGDFNIGTNNTIDMLARTVFSVKNIDPSGSIQAIYDHLIS